MNINDTKQYIKGFLEGKITIFEFKEKCETDPSIYDFLQNIVDEKKRKNESFDPYPFFIREDYTLYSTEGLNYFLNPDSDPSLEYGSPRRYDSVEQCLNYNWHLCTHNVKSASGASRFFNEVLVMYYQIDKDIIPTRHYSDEYVFMLDVIPDYLTGDPELYIQENIISLFPSTMKKTKRKKAIKAKIREEFKSIKGYPCWYQSSEWPFGKDGKPATYIGKGKSKGSIGRWLFMDESTGEIIIVEQFD
ncbi:MAG: hypothetical protein J1F32_03640 [Erysipelotrichales bacterium]|nr:hypothetical protein [Erysipelotrichales bacterium]